MIPTQFTVSFLPPSLPSSFSPLLPLFSFLLSFPPLLRTRPRALHVLSVCSTTELCPRPQCCLEQISRRTQAKSKDGDLFVLSSSSCQGGESCCHLSVSPALGCSHAPILFPLRPRCPLSWRAPACDLACLPTCLLSPAPVWPGAVLRHLQPGRGSCCWPSCTGSAIWLFPADKVAFLFDVCKSSFPCFSLKLPLVLGEVCVMILLLFVLNFARARPWLFDVKAA